MTFIIGIPQAIFIFLGLIGLIISINQHGTKKEGNHSVWTQITAMVITYSLIYWGGFFGCK